MNRIPEDIDFLYERHTFFIQYKLYRISEINFADVRKEIPFYELKHFLKRVINRIYFKDGKVSCISFVNELNHTHHFMYQ